MIRTQIRLEEKQYRALQKNARRRGISVAQIVREGVDMALAHLDRKEKWKKFAPWLGNFPRDEVYGHTKK